MLAAYALRDIAEIAALGAFLVMVAFHRQLALHRRRRKASLLPGKDLETKVRYFRRYPDLD